MSSPVSQTATGLIIPTHAALHHEPGKPVLRCEVCKREYPTDHYEKWVRHTRDCAERHRDEMEATVAKHQANPLANPSDPEVFAAIREGRT